MIKGKHYTDYEVGIIVRMLGRGCSASEIADELGRKKGSVQVRISKLRKTVGPVREMKPREPEQVNQGGGSINFMLGAAIGALLGVASVVVLL